MTKNALSVSNKKWWKEDVVYQIYPSSFKDSNGDGIGDIPGIISKLDYIKGLGVDVIWVSPFYKSRQIDMGYDISDYRDVHEPHGTVKDVEDLINGFHERGLKIIFDLVVNHTSDLHPWFKESSSSSFFSGSVWEWEEKIGKYYLHFFAKEQLDLNWENPEVREAIYEGAMRFWLDKGCDELRVDALNMYSKHLDFPDAPVVDTTTPWQPALDCICNGPRIHEFLTEMNEKVVDHYDCMTVGELSNTPNADHVLRYVSAGTKQLDELFQMDLRFIEGNDGWTTDFLENHDTGRSISRYASNYLNYRELSGKTFAILLTTLTGTTYVYQGQEIGIINAPKDWPIEEYQDIEALNYYKEMKDITKNDPTVLQKVLNGIQVTGRDHCRLPFQWDSAPNAGFTSGRPWIKTHDDYKELNAAKQESDPSSVLSFGKNALKLRKQYSDLFVYGIFKLYDYDNPYVITYVQTYEDKQALVVLNFTDKNQPFEKPAEVKGGLTLIVSNYDDETTELRPYEGRAYIL